MRHKLVAFLAGAVMLAGAAGAEPGVAEAAFQAGEYQAALAAASDKSNPDELAFSARALLAEAMSGPADPPEALLHAALDKADAALAIDKQHLEGRLQRAIALSLIIRPMSNGAARKTGWGEEARDLARSVLEDDPGNIYANGFLSVWNLEVVRRGGRIGAMMMGASISDGRAHYQAAIAADPEDAALHWQWARALAALDCRKYHDEITAALEAALSVPTHSALQKVMQARAATLKAELQRGDAEAEALAARML
ncbi:tetratricopeptide repeat protein [Hyphomonas pacifica]|uniref:Tetratrico peptide repeat group 5 domain-containing protein n=1 Tax=Hyphomonas pacifica TaxID=1280941 RepID=A0A062TVW8_9PROT|nr:hypothetical protein [Hyphomonas pacifica]KCZ49450.1 hypothetical protein HY2_03420 [Hyphomonas pacifica]RAN32985.1 hypothetical protein HY11_04645 [Hyphomonas pacifica]RAN33256.1 hypothetical protein HY3_02580 [Hyphomonas pacifica]